MTSAILASVSGERLTSREAKVLAEMQPVGVSLFARNINNKKQLKKLTDSIKEVLGPEVIIAVDQEGGRVRRLGEPEWPAYASQYVLGKLPPQITKMHAALIAQDLHEVGINFNYAPVLDIARRYTHEVLKSRCFSTRAANCGKIMVKTYCRNGICPCIKHMPGHGRVETDPHLGLPVLRGTMAELEKDIRPFRFNRLAPAGMTAHIVVEGVDDLPITMSAKGISELIRGRIGFDGLLITDAIEMKALKGSIAERSVRAWEAGCDVICYCRGDITELEELRDLDLRLTKDGERRLEKVREIIGGEQTDFVDYADYASAVGEVEAYQDSYDATEVLNRMNSGKGR